MTLQILIQLSGKMEGVGGASSWREVREAFLSQIIASLSGDYCPETRDNLMLLLNKMKLRRALKALNIPYQIMGDLKMMNTLTGFICINGHFRIREFKTTTSLLNFFWIFCFFIKLSQSLRGR